jgi:hypothetical protein
MLDCVSKCLPINRLSSSEGVNNINADGINLFEHNGITLCQNGNASQLVINCHGGWKELEKKSSYFTRQVGDGWAEVPKGMRLDFYTADGDFTKGSSVLAEVSLRSDEALLDGIKPRTGLSSDDLAKLAEMRNTSPENMEEMLLLSAIGVKETVQELTTVKDYALFIHEQNDQVIKSYKEGSYGRDIDIALVTEKEHKRHLSDVFEAIFKSGANQVIHFGACRVSR